MERTIRSNGKQYSMIIVFLVVLIGVGTNIVSTLVQSEVISISESDALRKELESIRTSLGEIREELKHIRQLLSTRPSPSEEPPRIEATIDISGNRVLGKENAPVTLVEFSDYQCPFCRKFFETTLPALRAEYINTGKVRYVFRDFPLSQIHSQARKAAEAAYCAGEQDKYWEMHDLLFQRPQSLQAGKFEVFVGNLGLNADAFHDCMESNKYATRVQKDYEDGRAAGVQGTPSFIIGKTKSDGMVQGTFVSGAHPIAAFRQVIEDLLREN
jgi:protein-disulfide isomerase